MIQPLLAWELARKDWKLFLADRKGVLLCFGIPILLASAFGAIFHRPEETDLKPSVIVVNQDGGTLAGRVVASLETCERAQVTPADLTTALRRLADDRVSVVVVLPEGFSAGARLDQAGATPKPTIQILYRPSCHVECRWVEGVLTEVILRESALVLLEPLRRLQPGEGKLERPFSVARQTMPAGGALSVHAYSHSFCGMTLQYLLFWGMDSGLLLLRERRAGIWRRLRAAPVTWGTLLLGKVLATAIIALAQVAVTFGVGAIFFGVGINGSVVGFLLLALSMALLSAATGLVVAALGGNEARARSVAILVILTLSLLGGLWLPAFLLPGWAQKLALALPTTWASAGLEGVTWQGMGLQSALACAGMVLAFSVVFLALAWWSLVRAEVRTRMEGVK